MAINPLNEKVYMSRRISKHYPIRGEYFRDQTAIIHSMPFRRLKHKTQVFFAPENDHVCTRIEHVLHVATVSSTICKGLNQNGWELDPELSYAIGLGHDLGHAPFGHAGEKVLNDLLAKKDGFIHEVNSYRVVEYLANEGQGLNLTYGVKDGIISHNGENFDEITLKPDGNEKILDKVTNRKVIPSSFEGCIVRLSDKISYLGRDIEDAIIANFIKIKDIPKEVQKALGSRNGDIINNLVTDVINTSKERDEISFSDEKFEIMKLMKEFNYDKIYGHPEIIEYKHYGENIIKALFHYLIELYNSNGLDYEKYFETNRRIDKLFGSYIKKMSALYQKEGNKAKRIVADYISGMTDNFALECMREVTIPKPIVFNKKISL